jgi:EAL domain-containing protein (putative c-di-GMP-specific phosphodiesterase class I)
MVKDEGCDEMQGFLIEMPKPMQEIPELAKRDVKSSAA